MRNFVETQMSSYHFTGSKYKHQRWIHNYKVIVFMCNCYGISKIRETLRKFKYFIIIIQHWASTSITRSTQLSIWNKYLFKFTISIPLCLHNTMQIHMEMIHFFLRIHFFFRFDIRCTNFKIFEDLKSFASYSVLRRYKPFFKIME